MNIFVFSDQELVKKKSAKIKYFDFRNNVFSLQITSNIINYKTGDFTNILLVYLKKTNLLTCPFHAAVDI